MLAADASTFPGTIAPLHSGVVRAALATRKQADQPVRGVKSFDVFFPWSNGFVLVYSMLYRPGVRLRHGPERCSDGSPAALPGRFLINGSGGARVLAGF